MPIFTPLQIGKLIDLAKQNRIAPIYLLIGPYEVTQEKARQIYRILLEKGASLEKFDLRDKEQRKEFQQTRGYQEGLFGLRKIYLVIGGEDFPATKAEEIVKSLKEGPQVFSWFVLAEKFDENHILYRFALEKGAIVPFHIKKKEDLYEGELTARLRQFNLTMDRRTAELFLELVSTDYYHFQQELDKLLLYCLDEGVITQEKLFEIVVPLEDQALYLLGDLLFNSGPEKAGKFVQHLLDMKKEPPEILAYLFRFFKKLALLEDVLKDYPELAGEDNYPQFLKLWQNIKEDSLRELPKLLAESHPYVIFTSKKYLKRLTDLDRIFGLLLQAEMELKITFREPKRVFQDLIFYLWREINHNFHQQQNFLQTQRKATSPHP